MHRNDPGERSQLIDLDALMAGEPPAPLPFDAPPTRAPTLTPLIPIAAPPRRPHIVSVLTTIALALAGGLALAAAAGGVAYSLSGGPGAVATTPADATPTRVVVGEPTPPIQTPQPTDPIVESPSAIAKSEMPATAPAEPEVAPAPKVTAESKAEAEPTPAPRARTERVTRTRPTPRPRPIRPAPPQPAVEDRPEPAAPAIATAKPAEPDPAEAELKRLFDDLDRPAVADPRPPTVRHETVALPERLTRRQILSAVRRISPRMKNCGGDGRYDAELRIAPAGRVETVTVRGADPAVAACVKQNVRRMSFPRFGGDPMTIQLPFLM